MERDGQDIPKREASDTGNKASGSIRREHRFLHFEEMGEEQGAAAAVPQGSDEIPFCFMPDFSGKLVEWKPFYGLFSKLVHENPQFSKAEKVRLLMECLKGDAKNLCEGFSPSEDNYEVVWKALVERYDNAPALGRAYLNDMLKWKASDKEKPEDLVGFFHSFDASVRALHMLHIKDLTDFIIMQLALEKLQPGTASAFLNSRPPGTGVPRYDELVDFVIGRMKTVDSTDSEGQTSNNPSEGHRGEASGTRCKLCREVDHSLADCPALKDLSPINRYLKIRKFNLCVNCFSANHGIKECPYDTFCDSCSYKHHKLLHYARPLFVWKTVHED